MAPVWHGRTSALADAVLAQSAIVQFKSAAHELVLDGESYRVRQKPGVTDANDEPLDPEPGSMSLALRWSHQAGARHLDRPATE